MNESAEYWAQKYMEQPWGGRSAVAYRHVLAQIRHELNSYLTRCRECEAPYIPTVLTWPTQSPVKSSNLKRRKRNYRRLRILLCPYCGATRKLTDRPVAKSGIFNEDEIQDICKLYEAGISSTKIAELYHCSESTIRNYLRKSEVPMKPPGGSPELKGISHKQLETIRFLYEHMGLTQKQIAAKLVISESTVQTCVRRGGMVRFGRIPPPKKLKRKSPSKEQTKELIAA